MKSQKGGVSHYSHLIEADGMEQNGRLDNIRVFGIIEQQDENPYAEVVDVTSKIGVTISKNDISVAHRLPSRRVAPGRSLKKLCAVKQKSGL